MPFCSHVSSGTISVASRGYALSSEQRLAIAALHRVDTRGNLRLLEFLTIWLGCGVIAVQTDVVAVRLVCYFVAGATLQGFGILMHEGVHGLMSRNRRLNRLLGFVAGLPALLSMSAYRVGHLPHHRHERGERDPDELENFSREPRILAILFCLTLVAGDLFGLYRIGPWNAIHATRDERRAMLVEYGLIVTFLIGAILIVPGRILIHGWLFPALVARQLTNVRTLAEHALTPATSRPSATRTVVSNRFVSYFMCNLNYHVEHHLYPAVPYYNLQALHRLLRDDLEAAGAVYCRSYAQFLRELMRFIWRALAAREKNLALQLPARG